MKRLGIALSLVFAVGCTTGTDRPSIEDLKPGLNMLDTGDATWGMTAAYVKDQHVVYLEQRVGALKPQAYRDQAPTEPANEIDMRFVDGNGKTFFIQRGGDGYVDPTWAQDITDSLMAPALDADRIRDFGLAKEAAGAMVKVMSADTELAPFAFHAQQFAARPIPTEDPIMMAKVPAIEASRPASEEYGNYSYSGSWWFEGDLYDKGTSCVLWYCPAKHSAVALFAYQTTWQLVLAACNHGSCAGASGMTYECYSNSGVWRTNATLSAEANGNTAIGGGCLTSYSWASGGNNHLCNDDSAYELWQVKNGSIGGGTRDTNGNGTNFVYTGSGTGGNGSWVNYACTCSYNNSCNNDWSRPICP